VRQFNTSTFSCLYAFLFFEVVDESKTYDLKVHWTNTTIIHIANGGPEQRLGQPVKKAANTGSDLGKPEDTFMRRLELIQKVPSRTQS